MPQGVALPHLSKKVILRTLQGAGFHGVHRMSLQADETLGDWASPGAWIVSVFPNENALKHQSPVVLGNLDTPAPPCWCQGRESSRQVYDVVQ